MEVEVLASVMNQTDNSIIEKMNIKTSAIIVNQCKRNNIQEVKSNNKNIKIISLNEKGVGLSRNTALMRATKDIVIFADEDETFVDDYEEIILNEFKNNSKADMIVFNVPSLNKERPSLFINTVYHFRYYLVVEQNIVLEKIVYLFTIL